MRPHNDQRGPVGVLPAGPVTVDAQDPTPDCYTGPRPADGPQDIDQDRSPAPGAPAGAETVLAVARAQLGTDSGERYLQWWLAQHPGSYPGPRWAAVFCSWVFAAAGVDADAAGQYGHCAVWAGWYRLVGRLAYTPVPGAVVFYDWAERGAAEHAGFVEAVQPDGRIVTIEGDVLRGDSTPVGVRRMLRAPKRGVLGYGLPFYGGRAA